MIMFDTKNRIRIILTIFILLLVSSFPSSTFAQKLDLANEFQASDTIPKLKEMPINKVKSLKKNDNTILAIKTMLKTKLINYIRITN